GHREPIDAGDVDAEHSQVDVLLVHLAQAKLDVAHIRQVGMDIPLAVLDLPAPRTLGHARQLGPALERAHERGRQVVGMDVDPHKSISALRCAPSIGMWAPLTKLARGEARKATTLATSSGSQIRPKGMLLTASSWARA